jgi:hypothetical protein
MPIASDVNLIQRRQQFLIHCMESAQFGGGLTFAAFGVWVSPHVAIVSHANQPVR